MREPDAWMVRSRDGSVSERVRMQRVDDPEFISRPLYALTPAEVEMLERVKAGTHVCVPKEPTWKMVMSGFAAHKVFMDQGGEMGHGDDSYETQVYRAMLEAANKGAGS